MFAEPDPVVLLDKLADYVLDGQERGISIRRAFSTAADTDPVVRLAYQRVTEGRAHFFEPVRTFSNAENSSAPARWPSTPPQRLCFSGSTRISCW